MSIFRNQTSFKEYMKEHPVTAVILLTNTVMLFITFFLSVKYGSGVAQFSPRALVELGGLVPIYVTELNEYYRLIAAMFLHGSLLHFLANAIIGIYVLSGGLEKLIGSLKFLGIYMLGGIGASLVVLFTNDPISLTIGASGAIFAVLGSLLYIIVYRGDLLTLQDKQTIKTLIILNIIFTFLGANISIAGHLGGFAVGFLLSYLFIRRNIFRVIN
jgi:rhomboid protease GluP